jgi:hypothetical protein
MTVEHKGLSAPVIPPGLPTNIQADFLVLSNLATYLNLVNTDAGNLQKDAATFQTVVGNSAEVQDVNKAYATLFTANGMTPAQQAVALQQPIADLVAQAGTIANLQTTITDQGKVITQAATNAASLQSQITTLQAQVTALKGSTALVTALPPAANISNTVPSNTTPIFVALAAVAGAGCLAWYVSKKHPSGMR